MRKKLNPNNDGDIGLEGVSARFAMDYSIATLTASDGNLPGVVEDTGACNARRTAVMQRSFGVTCA